MKTQESGILREVSSFAKSALLTTIISCGQSMGNQTPPQASNKPTQEIVQPYIESKPDINFKSFEKTTRELNGRKVTIYYEDLQGLERRIEGVEEVYRKISSLMGVSPAQRTDFIFSRQRALRSEYDGSVSLMDPDPNSADLYRIGPEPLDTKAKRALAYDLIKNGWHEAFVSYHGDEVIGTVPLWFSRLFSEYASDKLYGQELKPENNNLDFNQFDLLMPPEMQQQYTRQFSSLAADLEAIAREERGPNAALWQPFMAELRMKDNKEKGVKAWESYKAGKGTAQTDFLIVTISSVFNNPASAAERIGTLLRTKYNTPNSY